MFLNKFLDKNAYPDGKLPCIPPEYCVSQSNGKYATANEWCRVISHNPIMPALINHFFGGDLEGLFGATPFEVLHQLLLGIFKYILESLYNYRTIPEEWTCFFKEKKLQIFQKTSPIINVSLKQQTLLFLIKSNRRNGQRPKRTHAPVIKNIYTGKNQDPTLVPAPEMYFRNYTSNKVLDISIVIWKGKAIVIFQNCHTDLG